MTATTVTGPTSRRPKRKQTLRETLAWALVQTVVWSGALAIGTAVIQDSNVYVESEKPLFSSQEG